MTRGGRENGTPYARARRVGRHRFDEGEDGEALDINDPELDGKLNDAIDRATERLEVELCRAIEDIDGWNPDD